MHQRSAGQNNLVSYHSNNVAAKEVTGTAGTDAPALNFIRIGPQQVAHGAVMRNLLFSINSADLDWNEPEAARERERVIKHNERREFFRVQEHVISISASTWSRVEMDGERPPCTQKILLSMMADRLR